MLGIVIGLILASGGVYAATTIAGSNITYSNTKSGLTSTDVQGAIDELYEKADPGKVINKAGDFVSAYTYNQTSGASNYCVTGKEETCKKTTCYKTKTANNCPAGTIILYKVNDLTIVPFHVMSDNGSTMTMQSQKNIVNETNWISWEDNQREGGTTGEYGVQTNNKGPLTILNALKNATYDWSNVNYQKYTLGTTSFSGKGAYTGCDINLNCTVNSYLLEEKFAMARLITAQEATSFGCTLSSQSCPIWMYNYLSDSVDFGGTENSNRSFGYWLSSAHSKESSYALYIYHKGRIDFDIVDNIYGARAVVEVLK